MLDLHLTRGEHNDWVTLQLPTSPAEIGEVYAWLDCISTCVDDTRIAAVSSSVPNIRQHIRNSDLNDIKKLNTIGNFIDHCPDKVLLEEVKNILIPIQLGKAEPGSLFCPSMEEINAFYQQQEYLDMGMQMH